MSILAAMMTLGLQASPQTVLTVESMRGLSPAEVATRMGAAPGIGPRDAIRIVDGGRVVELYPIRRFWRLPAQENEGCLTGFEAQAGHGDTLERRRAIAGRITGLLAFENGRLTGVYPGPPPSAARPVSAESRMSSAELQRQVMEQVRAPQPQSPLTAGFGRLPLSDGAGALGRMEAATGGALVSLCRTIPERETYRSDPGMDVIWGLVGLTVLPFVPFQMAEESRAEREGGALLDSVEAGGDLGMLPEDWVRRRRGVRVYRDPADPEFAVIAIKLGSGADTAPKVGILGVRGTRVIWKAERDAADQSGVRSLVCLDTENRSTNARRGCSSTGFLVP